MKAITVIYQHGRHELDYTYMIVSLLYISFELKSGILLVVSIDMISVCCVTIIEGTEFDILAQIGILLLTERIEFMELLVQYTEDISLEIEIDNKCQLRASVLDQKDLIKFQ